MNNTPTLTTSSALDFSRADVIETIRATVGKELTQPEFLLFLEHCKATGLNPFKKEVWGIKAGGRLQVMTGINGFLAIANRHPQYDGMEVEVDDDAAPTKATCKVYRKDRKFPAIGVALLKEYGKDTPIWRQMPRVMLTKVAKSIAIREAFPQELNGLYTEEEMPQQFAAPAKPTQTQWYYNLALLDEHKLEAATQVAVEASATHLGTNVWESRVEIRKLARAEITAEEAAELINELHDKFYLKDTNDAK